MAYIPEPSKPLLWQISDEGLYLIQIIQSTSLPLEGDSDDSSSFSSTNNRENVKEAESGRRRESPTSIRHDRSSRISRKESQWEAGSNDEIDDEPDFIPATPPRVDLW